MLWKRITRLPLGHVYKLHDLVVALEENAYLGPSQTGKSVRSAHGWVYSVSQIGILFRRYGAAQGRMKIQLQE